MEKNNKAELIPDALKVALGGGSGGRIAREVLREIGGIEISEFDNIDKILTNADKEKTKSYEYLLKHKGVYWANRYAKISTLGAKRDLLQSLDITREMVMGSGS